MSNAAISETPATYRDFYEFEADYYRITPEDEGAWTHRRNLVHALLPADAGPRILDAGCGDGSLAMDLRKTRGVAVYGLDLALKRVAYAKSRATEVGFSQGSIYELPFQDGSFDTVVCTDLLEHLDRPGQAMKELVRVCSRNVIISVPYAIKIEKTLCTHCGKDYFLYGHQHSFGKEGIEKIAREAGASVAQFQHVIPMFECRRYKWFPPLKWLIWDHFKDTGTLGARIRKN
jgi:ubiquinone/menaquinone biosynthesis C-methylase UbiE